MNRSRRIARKRRMLLSIEQNAIKAGRTRWQVINDVRQAAEKIATLTRDQIDRAAWKLGAYRVTGYASRVRRARLLGNVAKGNVLSHTKGWR